ncbi:MAG: amino acid adenylation domain-containing protein [Acidobacteriota bacterium]
MKIAEGLSEAGRRAASQVSVIPSDEAPAISGCVHQLVERQVQLRPEAVAVRQGTRVLTYSQLNARANQLAHRLVESGASPESRIAVVARPSPDLIVAELAVMKAGCAFVPVDPSYPRARIDYILRDSGAFALLTTQEERSVVDPDMPVILIDGPEIEACAELNEPTVPVAPANLLYVIYTSGSTGRPKGVMVEHRSARALIEHFHGAFGVSHHDRAAFLSSCSFDASIAETWPYLACGASVHIPETPHQGNLSLLFEWLRTEGITTALIPTALAEMGLNQGFPELPALRLLLTGGDMLKGSPREALPFRFINAYGPTECTVLSTCGEVRPDPGGNRPPSIGKAISSAYIRILDEDLEPVSVGVPGEIYIGGPCLARGYLARPELTRERFIQDPFANDRRLYKTGDRACWRSDGEIAFLGRVDRQVQIRGFRIEPSEIEFVLKQEPGVEDAVVVPQDRDGYPRRLIGFLSTLSTDAALPGRVRARLASMLPVHMHPAILVTLESFPFTAHGKIDAARLPIPEPMPGVDITEPESRSAREKLWRLWRDATGGVEVRPNDNFFDCGGDSISLTILLEKIHLHTGVRISLGAFLQNPTCGHALELLEGKGCADLPATIVPLAVGDREPPLFLVAGAGGGVHWFRELVAEMQLQRPVYGLESQGLTAATQSSFTISGAAREFVAAIRAVQPRGPYSLAGYSLGGLIAWDMAARLREAGAPVEKLILLDTYARLPPRNLPVRAISLVKHLALMTAPERRVFIREKQVWLRNLARLRRGRTDDTDRLDERKRAEVAAALAYMTNELKPCDVLIELFTAKDGTMAWNSTLDRGWLAHAAAGIAVTEVSGGHYSLLQAPHVKGLAAEVARSLGNKR